MKDKFEASERTTILNKIKEIEDWAHAHHDADTAEFEAKQKEIESIFNPIIQRVYQAAGGAPGGGQFPGGQFPGQGGQNFQGAPGGGSSGPTVDEVD